MLQSCHSTVESEWVGTGWLPIWIGASHMLLRTLSHDYWASARGGAMGLAA